MNTEIKLIYLCQDDDFINWIHVNSEKNWFKHRALWYSTGNPAL